MTQKAENQKNPICGQDLDKWRLANGLSKGAAAGAFGLQRARWDKLTSPTSKLLPLQDPVLGMLLEIYTRRPECAPRREVEDVQEFYDFLELGDSGEDRATFAKLLGRSKPSICRLLLSKTEDKKPGRPVMQWMRAVRETKLKPAQARALMEEIAADVDRRNKRSKNAKS
jgi:hypothetical protein